MRFRVRIENLLSFTISMNVCIYIVQLSTDIKTYTETRRFLKGPAWTWSYDFVDNWSTVKAGFSHANSGNSEIPFWVVYKLTRNGSNLSNCSLTWFCQFSKLDSETLKSTRARQAKGTHGQDQNLPPLLVGNYFADFTHLTTTLGYNPNYVPGSCYIFTLFL